MPRNAATGRTGVNTLILWGAVIEKGFASQSWLTFRQALNLGGHVRRGETGTTVVYADRFVPKDEKARARETGDEPEAISFLKRFTLFNIDQCESLPEDLAAAAPPPPETLILPPAEALIRATGADEELCDRSKGRERASQPPVAEQPSCLTIRANQPTGITTGTSPVPWPPRGDTSRSVVAASLCGTPEVVGRLARRYSMYPHKPLEPRGAPIAEADKTEVAAVR